jgi:hypothetical protein
VNLKIRVNLSYLHVLWKLNLTLAVLFNHNFVGYRMLWGENIHRSKLALFLVAFLPMFAGFSTDRDHKRQRRTSSRRMFHQEDAIMMKSFTLGLMSLILMSLLLVTSPAVAGNADQGLTLNEFYALSGLPTPIEMTDAELAKVQGQDVLVFCACENGGYYVRRDGDNNKGPSVIFIQEGNETLIAQQGGSPHGTPRQPTVPAKAGPSPNAGSPPL